MEVDIVFFVIFIFNFIDNQFEDVFDSYKVGNVVKFIDNDGYMVVLGVEFFEYMVNLFVFWYDNCGV